MRRIDISPGDTYSRLTVVEEVAQRGRYRYVKVKCDCGNTKVVRLNDMRSGRTTSCGCYRDLRVRETNLIHGLSHTPEYRVWWDMVSRCTDISNPSYHHYGKRGITVCDEWRNDFYAFFKYVGQKPKRGLTIDRIDNNLGYSPGNVRWVTQSANNSNKRTSKRWVIDDVEYTSLKEASEKIRVSVGALKQWCKGWKCYRTGKTYPPRDKCYVRNLYEN